MKLNYDKMIEAMAKAMYENEYEHDWKWSGSFKEKFINSAKLALEALQGELPEVGTEHEPGHFYDKYNELKNLKED